MLLMLSLWLFLFYVKKQYWVQVHVHFLSFLHKYTNLSKCKWSICVSFVREESAWTAHKSWPPGTPFLSNSNASIFKKLPNAMVINLSSVIWTWFRGEGGGAAIVFRLTCWDAAMSLLTDAYHEVRNVACIIFPPPEEVNTKHCRRLLDWNEELLS